MNPLFADWHAEVGIDLPGEVLAARERAADEVVSALSPAQALDLVASAFQLPDAGTRTQWFRQAIKEQDVGFLLRGNDRQADLLAAACLREVLDSNRDDDTALPVLVGYACELAALRGWTSLLPDLPDQATHRLRELGTQRRRLTRPPTLDRVVLYTKQQATAITTDLPEASAVTGAQVAAALNKLIGYSQTALDKVTGQITAVSKWADHANDICAEEGNILGWLIAGTSTSRHVPWSTLPACTAAILAGRELAEQLMLLPAPAQADAFLAQLHNATPFTDDAHDSAPDPLPVAPQLEFLVTALPDGDGDPVQQAQHSLRQALLCDAWKGCS